MTNVMSAKRRTKRGGSLVTFKDSSFHSVGLLSETCLCFLLDVGLLCVEILVVCSYSTPNILGENREYFILIISFEGMYPQQSAYGDASLAGCSKLCVQKFSGSYKAIQNSLALWLCFYKIITFSFYHP